MTDVFADSDSEDDLPAGWEERATTDGRVYYAKFVILEYLFDRIDRMQHYRLILG